MKLKDVEMPEEVEQLDALVYRLSKKHWKWKDIDQDRRNRLSGYYGERNLSYYLGFLPNQDFYIFHDLRLPTGRGDYFQIDALIVTLNFILIVENKNYSGEIFCDTTFDQLIHTYEDKKTRYKDPLAQVIHQRFHFKQFLERHHLPVLPIEYLVAFTNETCILTTDNKDHPFAKKFLHAENIVPRIKSLQQKYKEPILDTKKISSLSKICLKEHTPKHVDVLKKHGVSPSEVKPGVFCPKKCGDMPMVWNHGKWECQICHYTSKTAHYSALYHYKILIKPTITNKELRDFLLLENERVAKNILDNLNLQTSGTKRWKVYSLEKFEIKYGDKHFHLNKENH